MNRLRVRECENDQCESSPIKVFGAQQKPKHIQEIEIKKQVKSRQKRTNTFTDWEPSREHTKRAERENDIFAEAHSAFESKVQRYRPRAVEPGRNRIVKGTGKEKKKACSEGGGTNEG